MGAPTQSPAIRDISGVPVKLLTAPGIPATTVALVNSTGSDCMVYIVGGTVTVIQITAPGGAATQVGVATPYAVLLPSGWSITLTYSVIPTSWVWQAL